MYGREYEEIIILNRRIDELLNRYNVLKSEKAELLIHNVVLRKDVSDRDIKIKELETKNERIKLTGALLGESGNADEAKKKITELVKEIDKCVALLNK